MPVLSTDLIFYKSLGVADAQPSCGGGIDISAPLDKTGILNALFDDIDPTEASSGNREEFRLIYIRNNNSTDDLGSAVLSLLSDSTSPDTTITFGLDTAGHNINSSITIVDEIDSTDLLSGITFANTAINVGNGSNILASDTFTGVWISRSMTSPASGTSRDECVFQLAGSLL